MRIIVKNPDWTTKHVSVTDKTKRTLKNGNVVPTWSAMVRKAKKV